MREVPLHASWERSDQEALFLELAKRRLNLRTHMEQEHLPVGGQLPFLGVVR